MTSQRDHALDGLRGIAAMAVVLAHIAAMTWVPFLDTGAAPDPLQYVFWHLGAPAVDLFFVLSGYVIAKSLTRKRQDYVSYMMSRYLRLIPIAWIAVLAGLVLRGVDLEWPPGASSGLLALEQPLEKLDMIGLATMISPITNPERINAVLWTLPVEIQAAFAMPILTWMALRWPRMTAPVVITALVAIALSANLQYPLFFAAFVYGAVLHANEKKIPKIKEPLRVALFGIGLLMARHLFGDDPFLRLICPVGAVFIILAVQNGVWNNTLRHPKMQWLGRISYPLYAIHWPIMAASAMTLGWYINPGLAAAASIPLALFAAAFLRKHVDLPAVALSHVVKSHAPR